MGKAVLVSGIISERKDGFQKLVFSLLSSLQFLLPLMHLTSKNCWIEPPSFLPSTNTSTKPSLLVQSTVVIPSLSSPLITASSLPYPTKCQKLSRLSWPPTCSSTITIQRSSMELCISANS